MMGDNYPVTDGARDRGAIHLGPVRGREAGAVVGAAGWVANAMALPHASMLPLLTVADQLWSPEHYDPEASLEEAIGRLCPGPFTSEVAFLVEHALWPHPAPDFELEVDRWLAEIPVASPELYYHLGQMAGLRSELPATFFAGELGPWGTKLARYGRAGLLAMDLVEARRAGKRVNPESLGWLAAEAESLRNNRVLIAGDVGDRLLSGALTYLRQ
jgi:hyaluronoglucosaminidase